MSLTGGCQCGAVTYEISSDVSKAYYCHCRMCQRAMGNVFATFVSVNREHFKWLKGLPKFYLSSKCGSRGFCPICGTPLSFDDKNEDKIHITVGSLDNPNLVKPMGHTGIESRLANFSWPDKLPKFETDAED